MAKYIKILKLNEGDFLIVMNLNVYLTLLLQQAIQYGLLLTG